MTSKLSTYFDHVSETNEQDLIKSLVTESIQHRGILVYYLLRSGTDDFLFNEQTISSFPDTKDIEMYLEEMNEFDGGGDMFGDWGFEISDNAVFQVSIERFVEEFETDYSISKPREGDLIYVPFANMYFEVIDVMNDADYYQKGVNYTYRLKCNKFTFSHEEIDEPLADTDPLSDIFETGTGTEADPIVTTDIVDDDAEELQTEADESIIFDPTNFSF